MANPDDSSPLGNLGLGGLEIKDYLDIAKRRRWYIVFCALGLLVASLVVAYRTPDRYRSETVIMVDPQQVPSNYVASTVSTSIQDRLSTIQQQVMSPTRLQRIVDNLSLYPELRGKRSDQDIIQMMQKSTTIEVVNPGDRRLSAFRIAYYSQNPQVAAKVANELAAQFIEENMKARLEQFNGTAEFLDSELQQTKQQLEAKEQELQRIKSQFVLDLPESKQYHLEALNSLRTQQRTVQDRISRDQQQKTMFQAYAPTVDLDSAAGSPSVSPMQARIQKLEAQLSDLRARYGTKHPDVRKVGAELSDLQAKAAEEEKQRPIVVQAPPPVSRRPNNPVIEAETQKLDQDIAEQTKLETQLEEQINMHVSKLERGPVFEQQMAGLMRDYDSLRSHYSSLLDKKLSAKMASELEGRQKGERFVILDPAPVPLRPYGPNRLLICFAGLFAGVVSGIVLAVLVEFSDESVRTEKEAANILGKPVLAGIPQILDNETRRSYRLRLGAVFAGTIVSSTAFGYLISIFSASLF